MSFYISFNWKTIKKWLIPIGIGIALYLGFNTMTVSADEVKVDTWRLDVNNEQLTLGKFNTYPSGYIYYNLTANTVIDMTELNNYQKTFYFRYTVCSDSDSSSGWSETSWVENVKFEMTNLNCSYTGSSYTGGRVQYITFQGQPPTQAVDPDATSDIYVVWGNLVVSNYYNASSLELINFEVSTTPFVLDPVDQTIINQNQQQIDEQEKTNEKLDDLKENQDKNTEKEIESQRVCTSINKDDIKNNSKYINSNGQEMVASNQWGVTDYMQIKNAKVSVIKKYSASSSGTYSCFYDLNKDKISCYANSDLINGQDLTVPENAKYFKATINNQTNEPIFELCQDGNQAITDSQEAIKDFISDDTLPESDISSLGNVQGLLPPGPVDSLLNIPFKFLSVINSSFGGVCVPLTGEFVYGSTLTLPCFGEMFYDEVPSLLLNFLSLIPASFILIKYLKHLYKKVDRAVSLETTADDEWGVL